MTKKASPPPWSVKGVERSTRDLARQSAQASGQTMGAWIEQAIRDHATLLPPAGAAPAPDDVSDVLAAAHRAEVRALEAGVERIETRASDMVIPVALKVQQLASRLVEIEHARVSGRTAEAVPDVGPAPLPGPEAEPPPSWPEPEPPAEEPRRFVPPVEPPEPDFPDPVPPPLSPDDAPAEPLSLDVPAPEAARPHRRSWAKPRRKARKPAKRRSARARAVGTLAAALVAVVLGAGTAFVLLEHGEKVGLPPRLADTVAERLDRAAVEGRVLLAEGEELVRGWTGDLRELWQRHTASDAGGESQSGDAAGVVAPPPPASDMQPAEPAAAAVPAPAPPVTEPGPAVPAPAADPPVVASEPPVAPAADPPVAASEPQPPAPADLPAVASAPPPAEANGQFASLSLPATVPLPAAPASPATAPVLPPATGQPPKAADPAPATNDPAGFPTMAQPPAAAPAPTSGQTEELEKAAREGDVKAQYELGVAATQPDSGPPDYGKAGYWFREAAVQGNASAQYNLGVLYEHGLGVGQDDVRALLWYHSAAEQGHARAQYNLGVFYAQGRGIPADYGEAQRWFKRAADQGVAKAFYNLAVLAEAGLGGAANPTAARAYMSRAALLGDPEARAALANGGRPTGRTEVARSSSELVGAIQHMLSELGQDPGRIDGMLGDKTRQAIRRFQVEAGLPQTGLPSEELLEALTARLDKTPKAARTN